MRNPPFFVTGLPRSRTSWLANWLTTDTTHCYHDLLADCSTVADMGRFFERTKADRVGNSDSGLPFVWEAAHTLWPEARWLVVERDIDSAILSFLKYFTARPYGGLEAPEAHQTGITFERIRDRLDYLIGALPKHKVMTVQFQALDEIAVAEQIWDFLLPNKPFNADRWALLDVMEMNPVPEKIVVDRDRINKLTETRKA